MEGKKENGYKAEANIQGIDKQTKGGKRQWQKKKEKKDNERKRQKNKERKWRKEK